MQRGWTGFGLVAVALAACAVPKQQASSDSPYAQVRTLARRYNLPPTMTPGDSARVVYWAWVERFGDVRSEFAAALGQPVSTFGDTLRNWHDSTVVDSLVTVTYSRIQARFFVGVDRHEFITLVSLTHADLTLPFAIGIGVSRADLERRFGPPDADGSSGDSLLVQFRVPGDAGGGQNQIIFFLLGNVVRKVAWQYFVD